MANEFVAKNGLISQNNTVVSGSLTVTGGITGSLQGTSSWASNAITASYVLASGVAGLSLTQISTGSITASVDIASGSVFSVVSGSSTLLRVSSSGALLLSGSSITITPGLINRIQTVGSIEVLATSTLRVRTTSDSLILGTNGLDRWYIEPAGDLTTSTDNAYDIGLVSSRRPRNVYAAGTGSVFAAINITSGSVSALKTFPSTGNTLLGSGSVDSGYKLDVNGTTRINGNTTITGSLTVTSSATPVLKLIGSGSGLFQVTGSQGGLFQISDTTQGQLFTVSDILGNSLFSVSSSGDVVIGVPAEPSLYTTTTTILNAGITTIYSIPTANYSSVYYDYNIMSASNARAGQIMAMWSGSGVNYTEVTTTDFGDTSGVVFGVSLSGTDMILSSSATTAAWTFKSIVRSI